VDWKAPVPGCLAFGLPGKSLFGTPEIALDLILVKI